MYRYIRLTKEKTVKKCDICGSEYSIKADKCTKCEVPLTNEYVKTSVNMTFIAIVLSCVVALSIVAYFIWSSSHSKQKSWEDNILMTDRLSWEDKNGRVLGSNMLRSDIRSVTFLDSTKNLPSSAWDVSIDKNSSVMAYVEQNGELYDLYIAGDGGINAKTACQDLFCNYTNVKEINFNKCFHTDNATSFGYMFIYCTNLESVDFNGFNTSSVTNMAFMFYACESLKELNVSNFDTSNVTNMESMFNDCASLSTLDISNFDTSNVTNMNLMFCNCQKIKELHWKELDTSAVTNMKGMFSACQSLEKLDVSSFDTSNVVNMCEMFCGCKKLEELDLGGFDTSNVTTMQDMFNNCTFLETLDISHFNTSKVTTMQSMFEKCTSLKSIDVSHFDTSNVTIMQAMFWECTSLNQIDVSNFDTSKVYSMYAMFYKCSSITELDISGFDTSQITDPKNIDFMFAECKNLNSFGEKLLLPASQINNLNIFQGTKWQDKKWKD